MYIPESVMKPFPMTTNRLSKYRSDSGISCASKQKKLHWILFSKEKKITVPGRIKMESKREERTLGERECGMEIFRH